MLYDSCATQENIPQKKGQLRFLYLGRYIKRKLQLSVLTYGIIHFFVPSHLLGMQDHRHLVPDRRWPFLSSWGHSALGVSQGHLLGPPLPPSDLAGAKCANTQLSTVAGYHRCQTRHARGSKTARAGSDTARMGHTSRLQSRRRYRLSRSVGTVPTERMSSWLSWGLESL